MDCHCDKCQARSILSEAEKSGVSTLASDMELPLCTRFCVERTCSGVTPQREEEPGFWDRLGLMFVGCACVYVGAGWLSYAYVFHAGLLTCTAYPHKPRRNWQGL